MEKPIGANVELPPSASPVLPRSWPHSQNAKPATRSAAKHEPKQSWSIVYASPPHLANGPSAPRKRGQSLGDAFAHLTAADVDRSDNMRSAVATGIHNAQRQDDYERSIMNDEAALINMGFWGRSEEDF